MQVVAKVPQASGMIWSVWLYHYEVHLPRCVSIISGGLSDVLVTESSGPCRALCMFVCVLGGGGIHAVLCTPVCRCHLPYAVH